MIAKTNVTFNNAPETNGLSRVEVYKDAGKVCCGAMVKSKNRCIRKNNKNYLYRFVMDKNEKANDLKGNSSVRMH